MGESISCNTSIEPREEDPRPDATPDKDERVDETREAGEDLACAELWIEFSRGVF